MTLKTTLVATAIAAFAGTSIFAASPSLADSQKNQSWIENDGQVLLIREDRRRSRRGDRAGRRDSNRRRDRAGRHDGTGVLHLHGLGRGDGLRNRRRSRRLGRVTASARVRGFGPRFVLKQRARRRAIRKWRQKVANRFGARFSRWGAAIGKNVTCNKARRGVRCSVSARPGGSFRRFRGLGFRGI